VKTLKISDDTHSKLTSLLGELTAETSKLQTYQDAINALIKESVMVPAELIAKTEDFIAENKDLGFTTKEEFVRDAIRFRLTFLKNDNECIEIPREQYDELDRAVKEMNMPFRTAEQFIINQIDEVLAKYEEYKKH
jgi:hypothetical protein